MKYTISNEYYTATVSSVGAELISVITAGGTELMWQSTSEEFWSKHSPLLFPVCGRLKDKKYTYRGTEYNMMPHGFINGVEFSVKELLDKKVTLVARASEETLAQYPFDFEFTASYELDGRTVKCSVTVKNNDGKVMPYMFGWHPGFALMTDGGQDINDYAIDFGGINEASWIPLQNVAFARPYGESYALPGGKYTLCESEIYKNDTMIFTDIPTRVKLSAENHPYELALEWSDNLPYLCVWKTDNNAAKFICLEPWTGTPADGETDECFDDRKMERLSPGESAHFTYNFTFTV